MQRDEILLKEAERATEMLRGKTVARVWRHRKEEVAVVFVDGTHLYVDCSKENGIEFSITGGEDESTSDS